MHLTLSQSLRTQRWLLLALLSLILIHACRGLVGFAAAPESVILRRPGFSVVDRTGAERAGLGMSSPNGVAAEMVLHAADPESQRIMLSEEDLAFSQPDGWCVFGLDSQTTAHLGAGATELQLNALAGNGYAETALTGRDVEVRLRVHDLPSFIIQEMSLRNRNKYSRFRVGPFSHQPSFGREPRTAAHPASQPSPATIEKGTPRESPRP